MRHDEEMDGFVAWVEQLRVWQLILLILVVLTVLAIGSAILTGAMVRRGLRTPWAIRRINRLRDRVIRLVKRPITIMVLDEVADVIQTGHYTRNISDALIENHDELKLLVAEKVRQDPNVRLIGRLPGYDTVVSEVSETTLRVLIEMLDDPRMDELISDLLRNNLEQIKKAVRDRDHENVSVHAPPDITVVRRRSSGISRRRRCVMEPRGRRPEAARAPGGRQCRCSSGMWSIRRPGAGRAAPAAGLGQDHRARRPARHRHVRGHVRVPDHHGPQPQPRDHDERHRDDLLPADRQGQGAELPRHVGVLRRRRQRHLRPERRTGRRHRRDPGLRCRAGAGRCADPLRRRGRRQPRAPAGRHRRRGHADRLQPGRSGHRHLPAGRSVDRVADHAGGDPDGGGAARLRRPDRDLPRPDLRVRRVLARRPGVRPDHVGDAVVRR